jgi:hypothetical protein
MSLKISSLHPFFFVPISTTLGETVSKLGRVTGFAHPHERERWVRFGNGISSAGLKD